MVHDGNSISKYDMCGFDCIPVYGDIVVWGLMPSMIDTYDLKLLLKYTNTSNNIKCFCFIRIKHILAIIR